MDEKRLNRCPIALVVVALVGVMAFSEVATACQGREVREGHPNATTPAIVTSDHRLFPTGCLESVLDEIARSRGNQSKPFVLFVSGRGEHPYHERHHRLLSKIEDDYGVTALMFAWPSWCGLLCFPEAQAREAGRTLRKILPVIAAWRKRHGVVHASIVTHSMGSIVLEGIPDSPATVVFDSLVISAPASAHEGHEKRLGAAFRIAERTYIVGNKRDKALRCLEGRLGCWIRFRFAKRLGREASGGGDVEYISFGRDDGVGNRHAYYVGQKQNTVLKAGRRVAIIYEFYRNVLNPDPPLRIASIVSTSD